MAALTPTRAFALVLAALALPTAAASDAWVHVEQSGAVWNGRSVVHPDASAIEQTVLLWVPQDARIHGVSVIVGGTASDVGWSAADRGALLVRAPADASAVEVEFDVDDRHPYAFRYEAPTSYDAVLLEVAPAGDQVVASLEAEFDATGAGNLQAARLSPVAAGDAIAIRVVEAGRVGEIPLLLTVGGLALLVLVGTLAWHRARPPLQGRAPEKLLDHLAELQARLVPPVLLFAFFNLFYFMSGLRVTDAGFLVPTWGVDASVAARAFEAIAERLVPPDVQLVVLRPADAVLAQVGMGLFLAFATVLPLLAYEIGAFIGPGLEPRERAIATRVLPLVSALFVTGALLAYLVIAPIMIRTLYDYAPGIGAAPLLAVGELVSFALLVILALGLAFELPVLMYVLARIGLVGARTFGKYVRHAILAIVVAAGLITPDPSVVSQLMLAVPIVALYVLGIGAAALGERARPAT